MSQRVIAINGEEPLNGAPSVKLDSGAHCIPQHYLVYLHTLQTIEQVVKDCQFSNEYLLMCGEDQQGLFIQIGVVGFDTYKRRKADSKPKIVYGRRWRIEPHFPTSELIQTVFLAVKKAREHEVRERFKIQINNQQSAPFSTHQDLPLIVSQAQYLRAEKHYTSLPRFRLAAVALSHQLSFDHCRITLKAIEQRANGQLLIDVMLKPDNRAELPETNDAAFTLLLEQPSLNLLLFALMDTFIKRSDDFVGEHFTYRNVARFSTSLSVSKLASLSLLTRQVASNGESIDFYSRLAEHNQCIDRNRAPRITGTRLAEHIHSKLSKYQELDGFLPE